MAEQSENKCPHCSENLITGKLFCPTCGLAIVPPDQKVALDAYITAKVSREIALKTQDQTTMVREIGNRAEDEVWKRITRYTWATGALIFLAGLYGFTSIRDAKQKIVDEARVRVEPVISDVERRAKGAQEELGDVQRRLPEVTDSLNRTAEMAEQQRKRIEGQGAEVSAKLDSFQKTASRADQLSDGFEAKVRESQKRLDEMTKRYDNQLDQISRATTRTSVSEAYPTLGQEPFVLVQGHRVDATTKRPGEKWVNIYISGYALPKEVISKQKLEDLVSELRSKGFVPLLGSIGIGGPLGGGVERTAPGPFAESGVFYFKPGFKTDADTLSSIVSKYITLPAGSPQLSDVTKMPNLLEKQRLDVLLRYGGIDAQIFISSPYN
jgi:hypothetical protein